MLLQILNVVTNPNSCFFVFVSICIFVPISVQILVRIGFPFGFLFGFLFGFPFGIPFEYPFGFPFGFPFRFLFGFLFGFSFGSDSLISLSYSMPTFSANSFGLFFLHNVEKPQCFTGGIVRTFNTIYINFLANRHICSIQIDEISMKEQKMAKKVIIWHCSALVRINFSDFCFTLKSSLKNIFKDQYFFGGV